MSTPKTVFFTGGAGFIGLHVVPGDVELIDQDIRYGGAVHQAMKGCEYVIHAAAVSINKSQSDPFESIDINLVGEHNVFAAAADHGVERLVFCSSASVYGDPKRLPMIVAVLSRHAGLALGSADVFVNVAGGVRIDEPGADLGIALAIASAAKGLPVREGAVAFGEIGLTGRLRPASQTDRRTEECRKFGSTLVLGPKLDTLRRALGAGLAENPA